MSHLPVDSKDRKAIPLQTGCYDYFPRALAAVATLSRIGNDKHNPGQPLHWSRDKSNDHANCIARHQSERGNVDPESGLLMEVLVAWRALAQCEIALEKLVAAPKFIDNAPQFFEDDIFKTKVRVSLPHTRGHGIALVEDES